MVKILVTGADGFIGKNLCVKLSEIKDIELVEITRYSTRPQLAVAVNSVDFIFHLAGVNRPKKVSEFVEGNADFTQYLCELVKNSGKKIPIVFTSSAQATLDNPYGASKHQAEEHLIKLYKEEQNSTYIFRLPGVFGKWCRPNYNSVVATFCYNVAHDLPITINDPNSPLKLVYVDDVVKGFLNILNTQPNCSELYFNITPEYLTTVGEVADLLYKFKESRNTLVTEKVGAGFVRALYSTYITYLRPEQFSYLVPKYEDPRGVFVEMLKTPDSGQFSFFTAPPGVTRGEHYHHTKTEKFLVIRGKAQFRFKHVVSGEYYEIDTEGKNPQIVETIPGWTHDITNIGDDEMLVMLWANEIFDRAHPDTISRKVEA
jgi:UDP-2-acetamido-2,6-beta-L-arabino-hexul-4-ose reductase